MGGVVSGSSITNLRRPPVEAATSLGRAPRRRTRASESLNIFFALSKENSYVN